MASDLDELLRYAQSSQQEVEDILARARARGDLADLSYANPYDPVDQAVLDAVSQGVFSDRPLALQYSPYGGRTTARRVVAAHLSRAHDLAYPWSHVVLTPGAMAALAVAFRCVRRRGGERVGFLVPCWQDYPLYLRNLDLVPVPIPLHRDTFDIDCDAVEACLRSHHLDAFVLSQPANPTGVLYSASSLKQLASLLARQSPPPLLISDEAHRSILFGGDPFVAPASFYPHTCTLHSFGKAYQIQGQRIGYVAVSPEHPESDALVATYLAACRFMGVCTPTSVMQDALPRLLKLTPDLSKYARRRSEIVGALSASGFHVAPGKHTFFVYARCEQDDVSAVRRLAEKRLLCLPGSMFHDPGHLRFSVTASDAMIERAVAVIREEVAQR